MKNEESETPLKSCEEIEMEALIQIVEEDFDLESNPLAEELYNKVFKDPRSEKAKEQFRRAAYYGAGKTTVGRSFHGK